MAEVKEYELCIFERTSPLGACIKLIRVPRGAQDSDIVDQRFPFDGGEREKAWTDLRRFLQGRGERILTVVSYENEWSKQKLLLLLTEPIAETAKPTMERNDHMWKVPETR